MKLPTISGVIRRRILLNYRVAPEVIQPLLPPNFRPKLHGGFAIAGTCLIRLEQVRPVGLPALVGISSENAAHRFAVVWQDEQGNSQEGVYVSRRDTDSCRNQLAGGRLFPGEQHAAKFTVKDDGSHLDFAMNSEDGQVVVQVRGKTAAALSADSVFENVDAASAFFEPGSLGYSATEKGNRLEAVRLKTATWEIAPFAVEQQHASFFADSSRFPAGTISFDCALIMRDIQHQWQSEADIYF
jgi:hypothetical protein